MRRVKIGERVGALISANAKEVLLLGYGVYSGEELPVGAAGFGPLLVAGGTTNPKLTLDNGDVVFGCECWWDAEESIRTKVKAHQYNGATIVDVRIADLRAEDFT